MFWANHCALYNSSRQYMSAIWYHDEEQKKIAFKSKEQQEVLQKRKLTTVIEPLREFYLAEDYHNKYLLQNNTKLSKCFKKTPLSQFVDSTPASKINGYLGGNGTIDQLMGEIESFNLPTDAQNELISLVKRKSSS